MLVADGTGRDPNWPVVERAYHGVDLDAQRGARELLRKTPQLASAGDWRMVVEKHAVRVAALTAAERDRDDLSAFRVVAEPSESGMRMNSNFTSGSRSCSGSGTSSRSFSG